MNSDRDYRFDSNKEMLGYDLMKSYPNISCFSTTRHGGCSEGNYASFNCTWYCGDTEEHVQQNLAHLCTLLTQRPVRLLIPHQTHSCCVKVVDAFTLQEDMEGVDAIITRQPGCCLCISTADCIPLLLYDRLHGVVAAVHAGWRGTVGRIVEKCIETMAQNFGTVGKDIVACIGPGISLDAFEVGDEVYQAFAEAGFDMERIARKEEKWHLDLWEANRIQLLSKGVPTSQIEVAGICTYTHVEDFFSARRLGIQSGRILTGIMIHQTEKK